MTFAKFKPAKFCMCGRWRHRRETFGLTETTPRKDVLAKLKTVLDTDVARFNQTSGVQLNVAAKQ